MARNGFGTDITRRTGSMNKGLLGMTYLSNGVQRVRVIPVNPQTSAQQELRAAFLFLQEKWAGALTDIQRVAWETARTGNAYYLKQDAFYGVARPYGSAKDLFTAMNLNWIIADGTLAAPTVNFVIPGTSAGNDVLAITSIVIDASAQTVIVTYTGAQVLETMVLRATPPVSQGVMRVTSVKSKFRNVTVVGASPFAAGSLYTDKFGALTGKADMKVFWEVRATDLLTGKVRLVLADVSVIVA